MPPSGIHDPEVSRMAESVKRHVVITAVTAALSMGAGFLVVYLIVGPSDSGEREEEEAAGGEKVEGGQANGGEAVKDPTVGTPSSVQAIAKEKKPAGGGQESEKGEPPEGAGEKAAGGAPAPAEPPPPQEAGPSRVALKDYFVFRCWQAGNDTPTEKDACGSPPTFEGLVTSSLSGIDKCVKDYGGKDAGKISLALKIYFISRKYRAWLGNSTTISGVEETSACIRQLFSDMPFEDTDHSFDTYLVFYNLEYAP
jgi:hypothetical protein